MEMLQYFLRAHVSRISVEESLKQVTGLLCPRLLHGNWITVLRVFSLPNTYEKININNLAYLFCSTSRKVVP